LIIFTFNFTKSHAVTTSVSFPPPRPTETVRYLVHPGPSQHMDLIFKKSINENYPSCLTLWMKQLPYQKLRLCSLVSSPTYWGIWFLSREFSIRKLLCGLARSTQYP